MQWQDIAHLDSYLAGAIAARGWEWWDEMTAEGLAESVGLAGERHDKFLAGWNAELADREQERQEQLVREYDEMATGYEKGDPAAR
jgi:hypothetical protein